ncbi:MAG: L,D-transpeptidase [Streptomyces sp.]|nr:L,D-transpeptidase [Streptomyces sp.]
MASSSSGIVIGLTVAALGTIGYLGYQASANVPLEFDRPKAAASLAALASKAPRDTHDPTALPSNSGTGERVVYSLDDDRVWLVAADGTVRRTFRVVPSTVDPLPGNYTVSSRSGRITGSDGVPVEHVVRFATVDGVTIGFSAAVDPSVPAPAPGARTGGIRQSRPDGDAMWRFATVGQRVVVIR